MQHVKKFFELVGAWSASTIKEDGYFFVVLTILNAPIIFFGENLQTSMILFWTGAFIILLVTAATHLLPIKIRRPLQAAIIIVFAVLFAANIFLLYKFDMTLNPDMLQIALGTNPEEAKEFLLEYVANFKVLGGLTVFIFSWRR